MSDLIGRQAAIDALWKALYAYEDKTEKQFVESDELDINDWIQHRIFVQNMSDIDRQTIQNLPTIEAEPFKTFAHWVASEVCNTGFEDMWSLGAFAEVACRKLYALGVVQKFRDEWVYLDKDELDGGENG